MANRTINLGSVPSGFATLRATRLVGFSKKSQSREEIENAVLRNTSGQALDLSTYEVALWLCVC
jgi:hypothetical protein